MEIVLIRGLPGSGKTTLAKKFALKGYVHCEADHFFEQPDGSYKHDIGLLEKAHEACYLKASLALQRGQSVVVANTFTRIWEMESYYRLADSFGCSLRVILATGTYGNIHNVSPEALARMKERFEYFAWDQAKFNSVCEGTEVLK